MDFIEDFAVGWFPIPLALFLLPMFLRGRDQIISHWKAFAQPTCLTPYGWDDNEIKKIEEHRVKGYVEGIQTLGEVLILLLIIVGVFKSVREAFTVWVNPGIIFSG